MRALPLTGTPAGNEAAAVAHSRFSPIAEEVAICVLPDARPYRVLHGNNNDDDEIFSVLFFLDVRKVVPPGRPARHCQGTRA